MAAVAARIGGTAAALLAAILTAHVARRRRAAAMRRLCYALPKAELHVHLHGCARPATVLDLAPEDIKSSGAKIELLERGGRSLSECFAIFDVLHRTVTSRAAVSRITREALDDFAADGVRYLELRTTPRPLSDADAEGYVRSVIGALDAYTSDSARLGKEWPMVVRLLLSVDRARDVNAANLTIDLALKLKAETEFLVGLDLSGNPTKGDAAALLPALSRARAAGLRVAIHCGEVERDDEVDAIFSAGADRLGHALYLASRHIDALSTCRSPPIEICPTSNRLTLGIGSLRHHPTLRTWLARGHPISINTDDPGVFATCASAELLAVAMAYGLSGRRVVALAGAPFSHAFNPDAPAMKAMRRNFNTHSERALAAYREDCGMLGRACDAVLGRVGLYIS
jgi:adenosine deaminase